MTFRPDIIAGRAVILVNVQDTIDKQLRGIRTKFRRFANSMSDIGGDLFRFGTVGTIGAFFPVRDFVAFQDQLLFIQTKLQATDSEMLGLEMTIRQLGKSTSFTSQEVGQAAQQYAQAGFSLKEVQQSLQAALDLARGGGVDLATSTTILANSLRTFQREASDASLFASKFITAARLGTLDIIDLNESLKESSGTFRLLNVGIDESLALITQLSLSSLKGTKAGTSLNTAFLNLASSADILNDKLGITITDSDLERPLQLFTKLQDAVKRLGRQETVTVLREIFNIRGGRAAGAVLIQGLDSLDDRLRQIRASTNEARVSAEKLDSKLGGVGRRALSAFQELLISLGSTGEGPLTRIGEDAAGLFNGLSKLAQINPQVFQTLLLIPPVTLAAGVAFLSMGFAVNKLASALTPLIFLNRLVFDGLTKIVGLNKAAVGGLLGGSRNLSLGIIGKPDLKFAKAQEKFQASQAKIREAAALRQRKDETALSALQQRNSKTLIELEEKQLKDRIAATAKANQTNLVAQARVQKKLRQIQIDETIQRKATDKQFAKLTAAQKERQILAAEELSKLERRKLGTKKLQEIQLTNFLKEQADARRALFVANQKAIDAIQIPSEKANTQELEKFLKRKTRIEAEQGNAIQRLRKQQAQERILLAKRNREAIAQLEVPSLPREAPAGTVVSKAQKKIYLAQVKAAQDAQTQVAKLTEKGIEAETKLKQKQAKQLAALTSTQTTELKKLRQTEVALLKQQAASTEKLIKEKAKANQKIAALQQKAADTELQLETKQGKALSSFRRAQLAETAALAKQEAQLLQVQATTSEKLIAGRAKYEQDIKKQEKKFAKQRRAIPAANVEDTNKLLEKQAKKRKALIARFAAEEAAATKQARKRAATIAKRLAKEGPVDRSSFLTKQRSGGFLGLGGLVDATRDVGRLIRGATQIDFRKTFKGFDIVKTLARSFSLLGRAAKGTFTILNSVRRFTFSLSGFLTIIELLILFGPEIPFIKKGIDALSNAFKALFRTIGETVNALKPLSIFFSKGFANIFKGNFEKGMSDLKTGFKEATNVLKNGLSSAWTQFVAELQPAIDKIKTIFTGLFAFLKLGFKSLLAVGGQLFGGIANILPQGTGNEAKDLFSNENITALIAGIGGAFSSIASGIISALAFIEERLLEIYLTLKQGLGRLIQGLGLFLQFIGKEGSPVDNAGIKLAQSGQKLIFDSILENIGKTLAIRSRESRLLGDVNTALQEFLGSLKAFNTPSTVEEAKNNATSANQQAQTAASFRAAEEFKPVFDFFKGIGDQFINKEVKVNGVQTRQDRRERVRAFFETQTESELDPNVDVSRQKIQAAFDRLKEPIKFTPDTIFKPFEEIFGTVRKKQEGLIARLSKPVEDSVSPRGRVIESLREQRNTQRQELEKQLEIDDLFGGVGKGTKQARKELTKTGEALLEEQAKGLGFAVGTLLGDSVAKLLEKSEVVQEQLANKQKQVEPARRATEALVGDFNSTRNNLVRLISTQKTAENRQQNALDAIATNTREIADAGPDTFR